jgi:hypothetical protein
MKLKSKWQSKKKLQAVVYVAAIAYVIAVSVGSALSSGVFFVVSVAAPANGRHRRMMTRLEGRG